MLFFFRGHNGPLVRAIVGTVLLVIGLAVPGTALLAGTGVVTVVWGGIGMLSSRRTRRQAHIGHAERMS
jgi:uncharacterized membrane protein (Fun14 family)